jgi:hypothetical protein
VQVEYNIVHVLGLVKGKGKGYIKDRMLKASAKQRLRFEQLLVIQESRGTDEHVAV